MSDQRFVTIADIVEALDFKIVYGEKFKDRKVSSSEVSRPGLILTGYKPYYPHQRIQLLGRTEMSFINSRASHEREAICDLICTPETPAIIIARDMPVPRALMPVAMERGVPIISSKSQTSRVVATLTNYLGGQLAERVSHHGVFVEVYGMGVMLVGDSGVGKSETGLELIQRGHRLIADDRVDLYKLDELTLIGEAPEILENLLEIRGLGIIDVMTLFGVSAIKRNKQLELIIELTHDDGKHEYERLGYAHLQESILDVHIPKIRIPVKSGRNLAVIIESAAMNFRASQLGHDARQMFDERLSLLIEQNREMRP
ncbi:Hpr(Ser) kinase/phosphatase [Ignavigranum ruoffiae]|uniref:HPr kinase/phosphorylase n=1 Tax=Ignavigranum ruoffiae TaxID=89093 RepID=A0A1H9DGS4_9LACT|nr:HPr(Ser) kinase/phosphatase [Ignavigranum ruoffiae]SEQ12517.1 Hpr(Ser) kinase/phosphatase [Ignavigranum ruoffiae]